MKLNLYTVRDTVTNKVLPTHFHKKSEAKKHRDELNREAGHERFVATYGPDHYRYHKR